MPTGSAPSWRSTARAFVVRQTEDARQIVERADAGAHLPAPVVPFQRRGAGIEAAIESAGVGIYGEAKRGLIRGCRGNACDGGRFLERSFGGWAGLGRSGRNGGFSSRPRATWRLIVVSERSEGCRPRESPSDSPSTGATNWRIFSSFRRLVKREGLNYLTKCEPERRNEIVATTLIRVGAWSSRAAG